MIEAMYDRLRQNYIESGKMDHLLRGSGISILRDFLDNWDTIQRFNRHYYKDGAPKVVLCGINPGRLGAGKTGIPLIDFASLSTMLPDIQRQDSERSAGFFHEVIQSIGTERFYRHFYVTNISWVGYQSQQRNVNYDQLPSSAQDFVYQMFLSEMELVSPTTIIALGGVVRETLHTCLKGSGVDLSRVLPHPNYCAFPKNRDDCKTQYIDLLTDLMDGKA